MPADAARRPERSEKGRRGIAPRRAWFERMRRRAAVLWGRRQGKTLDYRAGEPTSCPPQGRLSQLPDFRISARNGLSRWTCRCHPVRTRRTAPHTRRRCRRPLRPSPRREQTRPARARCRRCRNWRHGRPSRDATFGPPRAARTTPRAPSRAGRSHLRPGDSHMLKTGFTLRACAALGRQRGREGVHACRYISCYILHTHTHKPAGNV